MKLNHHANVTVNSISIHLSGYTQIVLSLTGFNYLMHCRPEDIHFGGENCEISQLNVGGKISFDTIPGDPTRTIMNVVITSDGTKEIDENGKLIKW